MVDLPPIPYFAPRAVGTALSTSELQLIQQAITARRYVRRAARVAFFSAGSMLAIGAISLVMSLFPITIFDIAVSLALLLFGYWEYRGSNMMKRADPRAPWFLCRNQLLLIAAIAVLTPFIVYRMIPDMDQMFTTTPGLDQVFDQKAMHDGAVHYAPLVIVGLIGLVAIFQGSLALYYLSRKRCIREYKESTPEWVQQILATTAP